MATRKKNKPIHARAKPEQAAAINELGAALAGVIIRIGGIEAAVAALSHTLEENAHIIASLHEEIVKAQPRGNAAPPTA